MKPFAFPNVGIYREPIIHINGGTASAIMEELAKHRELPEGCLCGKWDTEDPSLYAAHLVWVLAGWSERA